MAETRLVSVEEISTHNKPDDCWIVVQDKIWDVTHFALEHPGGAASMFLFRFFPDFSIFQNRTLNSLTVTLMSQIIVILKYAGRDATKAYLEVHSMSVIKENLTQNSLKGTLDPSTITEEWKLSNAPSTPVKTTPQNGEKPPLDSIINR